MITYSYWSEAGGVGKTTMTFNTAEAHTLSGYDTLAIDLDPQDAGLTDHAGLRERKHDDGDNLVRHLVGNPQGDVEELINPVDGEGFDIIPAHDMLTRLGEYLREAEDRYEGESSESDGGFDRSRRLFQVIADSSIPAEYDVLVIDCPATVGPHIENALTATGNVVVPVEVSRKGDESVAGIKTAIDSFNQDFETSVNIVGVVPNAMDRQTNVSKTFYSRLEEYDFHIPVAFRRRKSLFAGAWAANESIFSFGENQRELRDHEIRTRNKIRYLADLITEDISPESGIDPAEYDPQTKATESEGQTSVA